MSGIGVKVSRNIPERLYCKRAKRLAKNQLIDIVVCPFSDARACVDAENLQLSKK